MLQILKYHRRAVRNGESLWREQAQKHLRRMLAKGAPDWHHLTREGWQKQKVRWQCFLGEALRSLRDIGRPAIQPISLNEKEYTGFRLQRIVLEAVPGWTVGLSLFLPSGKGPFVPVLCPCGHGPKWNDDHQVAPQVLSRNGFAAALFDMPMFGERARDNDHFIQGPQSLMAGLWSGFYFLVDIVRVADYLMTRADIDASAGIGVTGVSGGGMATMFMPSVDPRVRAIAPVCCTSPLGAHVVDGLYTGCQENYMEGQAAAGLDLQHLLCLAAPTPCLAMAGRDDPLFRPAGVERATEEARKAYALEDASERFAVYVEPCGHRYTATMAREAVGWFRRWLAGERNPQPVVSSVTPLTQADLDCGTAGITAGMRQLTVREAERLSLNRRPQTDDSALRDVLRIDVRRPRIRVCDVPPPSSWGPSTMRRRVVESHNDLPLPALDVVTDAAPSGTILAVGEDGPLEALRQKGGLGMLRRRMIGADLRGYGELAPEAADYDIYGWCSIDRALGDLLLLSGETALGQQTRDALRLIDYAIQSGSSPDELTLYGRGAPAWPLAFAGILHPDVRRIVIDSALASFHALATSASPTWNRYHFLPHVLKLFDLPDLLRLRTDKRFLLIDPIDAAGSRLSEAAATSLHGRPPAEHLALRIRAGADLAGGIVDAWLRDAASFAGGHPHQ
jgi:hypothetical protein